MSSAPWSMGAAPLPSRRRSAVISVKRVVDSSMVAPWRVVLAPVEKVARPTLKDYWKSNFVNNPTDLFLDRDLTTAYHPGGDVRDMPPITRTVAEVAAMLADAEEIAFLDVREIVPFGAGH